jgi:hypothetical protein
MSATEQASTATASDRFAYACANLIGEVVTVTLTDGKAVEGIFVALGDDAGLDVVLAQARYAASTGDISSPAECSRRLLISAGDVVIIEATNAPFMTAAAVQGRVARASPTLGEMKRWVDEPTAANASAHSLELEAEDHKEGSWDQFEANKRAFGVETSYKEDLYTTSLDRSKLTSQQQAAAADLERQITSRGSRGVQHDIERGGAVTADEGEMFSDVPRGGDAAAGPPRVPPAADPAAAQPAQQRNWHKQPNSLAHAFAAAVSRRFSTSLACQPSWPHSQAAPCVEEDGGDYSAAQYACMRQATQQDAPLKVTVGAAPPPAPISAATVAPHMEQPMMQPRSGGRTGAPMDAMQRGANNRGNRGGASGPPRRGRGEEGDLRGSFGEGRTPPALGGSHAHSMPAHIGGALGISQTPPFHGTNQLPPPPSHHRPPVPTGFGYPPVDPQSGMPNFAPYGPGGGFQPPSRGMEHAGGGPRPYVPFTPPAAAAIRRRWATTARTRRCRWVTLRWTQRPSR